MSAALPAEGFVRLKQLIGDPKASPPVAPVLPVSKSTLWAGIKSGRYALTPIKLGPNCTAFRVEEVHALLQAFSQQAAH